MFSVLFDTNIYGRIFDDREGLELVERIKQDKAFTIHNFSLIRKELRKAPKILPLYDKIVAHHIIDESKKINNLARKYYEYYKIYRGSQGQTKIISDFKIVACASILGCDLVFSEDERTMKNPVARRAYAIVNLKEGYRTPLFYPYIDLKKRYF